MHSSQRELGEPKYLNQPEQATKQFCTVTLTQRTSREGGNKKRAPKRNEAKTKSSQMQMQANVHKLTPATFGGKFEVIACCSNSSSNVNKTNKPKTNNCYTNNTRKSSNWANTTKATSKEVKHEQTQGERQRKEGGENFVKEPKAVAGEQLNDLRAKLVWKQREIMKNVQEKTTSTRSVHCARKKRWKCVVKEKSRK